MTRPGASPSRLLAAWTLAAREWVRFFRQRNRVRRRDRPAGDLLAAVRRRAGALVPAAVGQRRRGELSANTSFPASLVLILLFTAIFATISIIEDRREGFLQSVLVAPVAALVDGAGQSARRHG